MYSAVTAPFLQWIEPFCFRGDGLDHMSDAILTTSMGKLAATRRS
jgi:hypothetical protein